MTTEQIIFLIVAGATLVSGLMVVTTQNLVHAALWLVATLFGVAVVFAILNAGFIAVVESRLVERCACGRPDLWRAGDSLPELEWPILKNGGSHA
jgi:hypothetical protein